MLRGQPRITPITGGLTAGPPPLDSAFASEPDRPPGIRFYRAKDGFFLPYSLLKSIHWQSDKLNLRFADDEVTIEGQGLHALYVALSEFKVARVCEQQDDVANEDPVHVTTICREAVASDP